ncbi:response regulator [Thermodesulfobacteriota bacterium]
MSDGLDVIVVDDDPAICKVISDIIKSFYIWGEVLGFTSADDALVYCQSRDTGIAIFIIDVFLGEKTGFDFLDAVEGKFSSAHEDSVLITGQASDDIVNMCISSSITHLLEKPIRPYALQLAVRTIVTKYLEFAKKLLKDASFASSVSKIYL